MRNFLFILQPWDGLIPQSLHLAESVHHSFLHCWTDSAGWYCLFDPKLENPAASAFLPSDHCPGGFL